MQIISRKEAKARGLKRYFTGKPCKYGHVGERYLLSGLCVNCSDEYYAKTWPVKAERARKRYLANPEREKERRRKYRLDNPEKVREFARQYRLANAEKVKERKRRTGKRDYARRRGAIALLQSVGYLIEELDDLIR